MEEEEGKKEGKKGERRVRRKALPHNWHLSTALGFAKQS